MLIRNKKRLFHENWEFSKQPLDTGLADMLEHRDQFRQVGIPHDWLIYNTENLYEDSTGWYRTTYRWEPEEAEEVRLRFEGVYMDSRIYVNPEQHPEPVFLWKYGYTTFEVDLTPWLVPGENEIWVSVRHQAPNSRWYTGAGIYRNVWLITSGSLRLVSDGIYFHAEKAEEPGKEQKEVWKVRASAEVCADREAEVLFLLKKEQETVAELGSCQIMGSSTVEIAAEVSEPEIWDVEHPFCYELEVVLKAEGVIVEREIQKVGFRTLLFTPEQGFVLNGRKMKLNGVCDHHDLGCLGSAFHPEAMKRKLSILKEMGCNAIRLAHNMSAPALMDLADEMGFLIVTEAFDMWESSKTPYDYGRFFPEWYQKDVASWVRRDRNHPCLLLYSIGNEIYDTHTSERGQMWTRVLMEEVAKHDPWQNARITIGSNYMPWENAQKCAEIIKIAGYNYGAAYYADHHEKHPDWVIYGSETASVVQSRGIYHFPYEKSVLADVDEQCSSLGNSTTSWGARSAEACIAAEIEHPYSAGQFLWSGFDYIGEPTPYHTRNAYFGQIDTAGFPKDSYYIYQAAWNAPEKKPVLHLFPYWDFNEGQRIDVRVYSNCAAVELFVNGKSLGLQELKHAAGREFSASWKAVYETGEIEAIAYDETGEILARDRHHSFGDAEKICLKSSGDSLRADGQNLLFVEISMEDAEGYPVENAVNRVQISVTGSARLIGTDNGDSTEKDSYKSASRRLFSGKLLAVIKADTIPGECEIRVSSEGMRDAVLKLPVLAAPVREGSSSLSYGFCERKPDQQGVQSGILSVKEKAMPAEILHEIPVRKILLHSAQGTLLTAEKNRTVVTAVLCPASASDRAVEWTIVDDAGIPSTLAVVEAHGSEAVVTAKSDGKFRLRCMSRAGGEGIRVISQLEFTVTGLGTAYLDPYGFITGGLYDYSQGNIGNGNEHGFATARDGESQVGFHDIDFGPYGSDEMVLPVFALTDDPYEIQIYEGMPGEEGAELVGDLIYQKVHIWNVYQPETYRLRRRLKGVTSLCFVLQAKVHIKGFSFVRKNRALETLYGGECDKVYGDSFLRDGQWIREIGNNVTLEYQELDFGENGVDHITVCGRTPLANNAIILQVVKESEETRQVLEFTAGDGEQEFAISPLCGKCQIRFVFLPGSQFDYFWSKFR